MSKQDDDTLKFMLSMPLIVILTGIVGIAIALSLIGLCQWLGWCG